MASSLEFRDRSISRVRSLRPPQRGKRRDEEAALTNSNSPMACASPRRRPRATFDVLAGATGWREGIRRNHSREVDGIGDSLLRAFVAICLCMNPRLTASCGANLETEHR